MPRAVDGTRRKDRRKKILEAAKGFWGRRKSNYRHAKDTVKRAMANSSYGRKKRARDFRKLWITRISAALMGQGISYSRFIEGLNKKDIRLNRKILSNLAIEDHPAFLAVVEEVKKAQ
jgi:large subunit ribosomal protein L20